MVSGAELWGKTTPLIVGETIGRSKTTVRGSLGATGRSPSGVNDDTSRGVTGVGV